MARASTLARFETSGEILSEDVMAALAAAECKLPGAQIDAGEFAAAWDLLSDEWQRIRTEVSGYDTERLRRRWIMPLLELLGHEPKFLKSHTTYADGRTIPLTHRAGDVSLWLLDYAQSPDEKLASGRRRQSPHELFQEYLDLTDDDWGIVCTGRTIRLLHDYHKTLTRNFVEADLESIFDALDVDAFRAVYRIFRSASFLPLPAGAERTGARGSGQLPIERLRDHSRQAGAEIGKELRKQVLEALRTLGNGFLAADGDGRLREALLSHPDEVTEFYRALLRIVYRLLFLLYVENKPGWMPYKDDRGRIWASSYSITRLREQAEEAGAARSDGEDYWEGLKVVFGIVRDGSEFFDVHPYGGELFDDGKLWQLAGAALRNSDLLRAIHLLTVFERDKQAHRVNFRALQIDALGSVYEGLLDVAPVVTPDGVFQFAEGTERKLTGSYYTPPELVAELIKSALVPVIEDRLQGKTTYEEKREALLSIKVVDPACGSGAFLVQALDKLTEYLVLARYPDEEPRDEDVREARRDVVTHCIHGVDLNPMAVELCKFTLWLHVAHPKLPLSYLEPRVKCGNSLIGVPLKQQVREAKARIEAERERLTKLRDMKAAAKQVYVGWPDSVPDEAFEPVTGDDKTVAKRIRNANKLEREQAAQLTMGDDWLRIGRLSDWYARVLDMPEDTLEHVRQKAGAYGDFVRGQAYEPARLTADTWCAAFFWPLDEEHEVAPTTKRFLAIEKNPNAADYHIRQAVTRLSRETGYFHWELEFPAVFARDGFDCVLGNPPWERIKLQEQEFFESRAPEIAAAGNKAARQRLISRLAETRPQLDCMFRDAKHAADAESKFVRGSGWYPLTAVGDVNTYAVFAETNVVLTSSTGRTGMVVPTGIATDDTTKGFFNFLVRQDMLRRLCGYENEGCIFPGVHHAFKFALLTAGRDSGTHAARLAFQCRRVEDSADPQREFTCTPSEFALLNPNTRTCPTFRTRTDAALTKALYARVPVLWQEEPNRNTWGVRFMTMFHMANDSGLFHNAPGTDSLPLYEAKMLHQFDHRHATYEGATAANFAEGSLPQPGCAQKSDPGFGVQPRYWVDRKHVEEKLARLPEGFVGAVHRGDHKAIAQMLAYWVTGYNLNRGDEGDDPRGTIGNRTLADLSGTLFGTMAGDLARFVTNREACRALERNFPLTGDDIRLLREHPEENYLMGVAGRIVDFRMPSYLMGWRDVARAADRRTVIASMLPRAAVGDKFLLIVTNANGARDASLLACLNSIVLDYVARQKTAGTALKFYFMRQLPVPPPAALDRDGQAFVSLRVLELCYTGWDMRPFASALGYEGPPYVWDDDRRTVIRAELDAYYGRLYGLTRKQLRYILDPHGLSDHELADILDPWEEPSCAGPHLLPDNPTQDFPGETFRVLKQNEERKYGEYRTRRLVLDAWAKLEAELGPVVVRNYREEMEKAAEGAKVADVAEGKARRERIVVREAPAEYQLVPPPPPKPPAPAPEVPLPGTVQRVTVNGRPAALIRRETTRDGDMVTVLFDGEERERKYLTSLADVREVAPVVVLPQ